MPEKSRERRVKVARRQGKATAIKSSDVGQAKGLSRHAAKKSSHVEGLRSTKKRTVSRKRPPGQGRTAGSTPPFREPELPAELPRTGARGRVAGVETSRPAQRTLSRRSPSQVAAKERRTRKAPAKKR